MRHALIIIIWIATFPLHAADAQFVPKPKADTLRSQAACQKKIEKLVRDTARLMGYRSKFGLQLSRESAGVDLQNRPLVKYKSGVFIVDEGYLSESGSEVLVRVANGACEPIRINVSIGG
jgi:hypothetical protein